MAVVVPLVAAFATGAAGMAAIGAVGATALGIASGYAMVAGAVLSGVGALTGKKDLMKIGGILSLAGGVGSIANAASGAADAAMQEVAGKAAAESVGDKLAKDAVTDQLVQEMGAGAAQSATEAAGQAASQAASGAVARSAGNVSQALTGQVGADSMTPLADSAGQAGAQSAAQASIQPPAQSAVQSAVDGAGLRISDVSVSASGDLSGGIGRIGSKLASGAESMGAWVKSNKELLDVGGKTLNAMYGPEAELVDMKKQEFDRQQSLLDRAYANLNAPVRLYSPRLQAIGGGR